MLTRPNKYNFRSKDIYLPLLPIIVYPIVCNAFQTWLHIGRDFPYNVNECTFDL